jgi:hypothetical protein
LNSLAPAIISFPVLIFYVFQLQIWEGCHLMHDWMVEEPEVIAELFLFD